MLAERESTEYIPGGATQNAVRVAQWLLRNDLKVNQNYTAYIGCVGSDQNAEKMESINAKLGVTSCYMKDSTTPTGTCAVLITGTDRSLCAHLAAANNYKNEHLKENWAVVEKAQVVYSAGFFITVSPDSMLEVAGHCKE